MSVQTMPTRRETVASAMSSNPEVTWQMQRADKDAGRDGQAALAAIPSPSRRSAAGAAARPAAPGAIPSPEPPRVPAPGVVPSPEPPQRALADWRADLQDETLSVAERTRQAHLPPAKRWGRGARRRGEPSFRECSGGADWSRRSSDWPPPDDVSSAVGSKDSKKIHFEMDDQNWRASSKTSKASSKFSNILSSKASRSGSKEILTVHRAGSKQSAYAPEEDAEVGQFPFSPKSNGSQLSMKSMKSHGTQDAPTDLLTEEAAIEQEKLRQLSFVDRSWFVLLMGCVTVVNAVMIGIMTDIASGEARGMYVTFNNVFALIYMGEASLRLVIKGLAAMQDNITVMDTFIALTTLIGSVALDNGYVRAMPVFRLFRVLRLLSESNTFQGNAELRMLMKTSVRAMKMLFWVTTVVLFTNLAAGHWLTHLIGLSAKWNGTMNPLEEYGAFERFDNREYFGSTARTVLSMLQVVTLSDWANNIARPIMLKYWHTSLFFLCLILLIPFGFMQAVVAHIVQDGMADAQRVEAKKREMKREDRKKTAELLTAAFEAVDMDGNCSLSIEEIQAAYKDRSWDLEGLLLDLGVPEMCINPVNLINLFDVDGDGEVMYPEMVEGIIKLDDFLQPKDYIFLDMRITYLFMKCKTLGNRAEKLANQVRHLRSLLQDCFEVLQGYADNKDLTDLHWQAMKSIKYAGPPVPPMLKELLPPPVDESLTENSGAAFMSFTQRYLGGSFGGPPPEAPSEPAPKLGEREPYDPEVFKLCAGKGQLGEAPEWQDTCDPASRVKREYEKVMRDDKYGIIGAQMNPNLYKLKDEIQELC